jgi:hypothetical protein
MRLRATDKVRVYFDRKGNSLNVWFDDPKKEHVCEEMDDDVVLIKDRRGRVIGFERLNYRTANEREDDMPIPVEVQMVRGWKKPQAPFFCRSRRTRVWRRIVFYRGPVARGRCAVKYSKRIQQFKGKRRSWFTEDTWKTA